MAVPAVVAALGTAAATLSVVSESVKAFRSIGQQLGSIQDEVVVTVSCPPGNKNTATRQQAYHLAASIGFGLVARVGAVTEFLPPPGAVSIQYDAASNEITFYLRYNTSMAYAMVSALIRGDINARELSKNLPVLAGPKESTDAADWNFKGLGIGSPLAVLPGLTPPNLANYAGRTQLTRNQNSAVPDPTRPAGAGDFGPSLNPRPAADGRSRGTWVSLVYSALTLPGSDREMLYPTPPASLDRFRGG